MPGLVAVERGLMGSEKGALGVQDYTLESLGELY